VLEKSPSAELRPDQFDDQSLPPYDELDPLLELYVEGDATAEELIARGHDPALVLRITRLVDRVSTSAARCRRGCASRARPSAATGACPSPTPFAPSKWMVEPRDVEHLLSCCDAVYLGLGESAPKLQRRLRRAGARDVTVLRRVALDCASTWASDVAPLAE
jgi:hypothetical protein